MFKNANTTPPRWDFVILCVLGAGGWLSYGRGPGTPTFPIVVTRTHWESEVRPRSPPKTHPKIYKISTLIFDRFLEPKWPQHRQKSIENPSETRSRIQDRFFIEFWLELDPPNLEKPVLLKENKVFRGSALFVSILNFVQKTSQNQVQNQPKTHQTLDQKHIQ